MFFWPLIHTQFCNSLRIKLLQKRMWRRPDNKSTEPRNTGLFLLPRFLMVYVDEAWREVTEDFQYPLSLKMQYQRGDRVECPFAQTRLKPFLLKRQRQVTIKSDAKSIGETLLKSLYWMVSLCSNIPNGDLVISKIHITWCLFKHLRTEWVCCKHRPSIRQRQVPI